MSKDKNTIVLITGAGRREEGLANQSGIKPGMLVELTSADQDTYNKHATEGGRASVRVATEDYLQGNTIDDAYDYTSGEEVIMGLHVAGKGDKLNVLLESGVEYTKGDMLISAGNGLWKRSADASSGAGDFELAELDESIDLSASDAVDTLAAAVVL